ncbi:hypothetical protein PFISCL1PPCAC_13715, partial [Pristionchus fissidentatus]
MYYNLLFSLAPSSFLCTKSRNAFSPRSFLYLCFNSQSVRRIIHIKFSSEYDVDLLHGYALANAETKHLNIAGTLSITTMMQLQILIICFCGWKIHWTIKIRTMSTKLKRMHSRALKLLISQLLAMSLALFPIVNPIIIIYFTETFKRFVFGIASNTGSQFCFGTSFISFIFNGILLCIVYKRGEKTGFYR